MKKPVSSQPEASLDWMAAFKLTLWTELWLLWVR
jgi:hypothetical protein